MAEVKQTTPKETVKETVTAKTTETKKVETKNVETKKPAPKVEVAKTVTPKKVEPKKVEPKKEPVKAKTIKKEETPKAAPAKVVTKTETKAEAPKTAAKKTAPKKAAPVKQVKETIESLKLKADETERAYLVQKALEIDNIQKDQFDATSEQIVSALTTLSQQLDVARAKGSVRAKEIVEGFGGEGRMNDLITDLAGYMGEIAGAGAAVTSTPLVVMAGAAKGIYKKVAN